MVGAESGCQFFDCLFPPQAVNNLENMKKVILVFIVCVFAFLGSYFYQQKRVENKNLILPQEKHFSSLKQLSFGGENAEAYFSFDGKKIIFQSTPPGEKCDQIYTMNLDGSQKRLVSSGLGKTTCSYFFKDEPRIFYSSTHLKSPDCPPRPDYSQGYVWPLDDYDIFSADLDGLNIRQLTSISGYDAEGTLSPDGKTIIFTSTRNGDLDLYTMDVDGKNIKQLTHEIGYDGGAFFSFDGELIVYRAYHPQDPKEILDYKKLLKDKKIRPTTLQIYVMNQDGSHKRQVTNLPGANFAPFFLPDNKRVIFSSNHLNPDRRNFDLFIINMDGTGLEQITYDASFDGFPMFTQDGKKLIFSSNRNAQMKGETNVFLAEWKD